MKQKEKEKSFGYMVGELVGTCGIWFISAAFIMWGWNILAPHINAPTFGYWEVFAMRMGLSYFLSIIWQKKER